MLGGGFLKQAQDSFVHNRELRQEALKLSMKNSLGGVRKVKERQSLSHNDPIMTASARALLRADVKRENRNTLIKSIVLTGLVVAIFVFFLFRS